MALVSDRPDEQEEAVRHKVYLENDSYYWLTYARQMLVEGKWRIRHTHADNAPYGREVHWSQSVSWLLVVGAIVAKVLGVSDWTLALEAASVWINPLLHALMVGGLGWVAARRFGVVPGMILALLLASLPDIAWNFLTLRPDHQTLHLGFAIGGFFALVVSGLGWTLMSSKLRSRQRPAAQGMRLPSHSISPANRPRRSAPNSQER